MKGLLTHEELEALKKWPTPAIANAIELFNIKPRSEGFMLPEIKCQFPKLGTMIGYAATAVITAQSPDGRRVPPPDYWAEIQKIPAPRVAVIHDIDNPVIGSFWGEVNANIHKALGCVGTVTDGSVRDMDEVEEAGFHFFSGCVSVSHAYVHLVDIGIPVKVGGPRGQTRRPDHGRPARGHRRSPRNCPGHSQSRADGGGLGAAGDQLLQIERVQPGGFEEAVYVRQTRVASQITTQGAWGGERGAKTPGSIAFSFAASVMSLNTGGRRGIFH